MKKQYKCTNYGICSKGADKDYIFDESEVEEKDGKYCCPHCHQELEQVEKKPPIKKPILFVIAAFVLVGGCIAFFVGKSSSPNHEEITAQIDSTLIKARMKAEADSLKAVEDSLTALRIRQESDSLASVKDGLKAEAESLKAMKDSLKAIEDSLSLAAETLKTAEDSLNSAIANVQEKNEKQKKQSSSSLRSGTLTLSYGKYTGAIKNGYPHGQGRLTYTKERQIYRNDTKRRMASKGDYVVGEFYNGFVVYGKLYSSKGTLLSSLNFGVGPEDSYDSK